MAKAKKKSPRSSAPKTPAFVPSSSLAPQVLEQAAQGWLQSAGSSARSARPAVASPDHRLTAALTETLQELREELAELRARLDRLENR